MAEFSDISKETIDKIAEDYVQNNLSVKQLIEKYGIGRNRIYAIIKENRLNEKRKEIAGKVPVIQESTITHLIEKSVADKLSKTMEPVANGIVSDVMYHIKNLKKHRKYIQFRHKQIDNKIKRAMAKKQDDGTEVSDQNVDAAEITDTDIANIIMLEDKHYKMVRDIQKDLTWRSTRIRFANINRMDAFINALSQDMMSFDNREDYEKSITNAMTQRDRVEAMKMNRVPMKALEHAMTVAKGLIEKHVDPDSEEYEKAIESFRVGMLEVKELVSL